MTPVADGEVEVARQRCLVEVDAADHLVGIERAGDAGGYGIVLDADEERIAGQVLWAKSDEKAAAASGFEHLPAGKAEAARGVPHGPDDVFGRVVGILRRALERLEFDIGHLGDEAAAQLFPPVAEVIRATGKDAVRELGRTEAGEFCDDRLLGRCCRSLLAIQQVQQSDRLDIVVGPPFPRGRQRAPSSEREIRPLGLCHRRSIDLFRRERRRLMTLRRNGLANRGNDLVEVEAQLESQRGCTVSHGVLPFSAVSGEAAVR